MTGATEPTPVVAESCDLCRFDGNDYTTDDVLGTLRALERWWIETVRDIDPEVLDTRPEPDVWSASEYARHSSAVTWFWAEVLEEMRAGRLDRDIRGLPDARADDPAPRIDASECISEIGRQAQRMATIINGVGVGEVGPDVMASLSGRLGDQVVTGDWVIRHAIHDATHHLADVGRDLYALVGAATANGPGSVHAVNLSDGGVPKRRADRATVGRRGIDGDRQHARKHHGRVWQALCLYSIDVIEALQDEGHPIEAGSAGENITVQGLDWVAMRPGVRLGLGEVVAEVTVPATPCSKNAAWFLDGDFHRMDHERFPGWSRWYAKVLVDGEVRPGDPVTVDP